MTPPPGRGIVEKLKAGETGVEDVLPGEAAVAEAARHSLEGRRRGLRGLIRKIRKRLFR